MKKIGQTALRAGAFAVVLTCAHCAKAPPAPPACLDKATDTVHLQVRNPGPGGLRVPQSPPDIGCCRRSGLSVAVTDAGGRDLDRCGFADNFDLPRLVELAPGEAIEYRFSAMSLSTVYCKVDLGRHYLGVHDGTRSLGTHPLVPCAAPHAEP